MNLIPTAGADCRPTSFPPLLKGPHDPQSERVGPIRGTNFHRNFCRHTEHQREPTPCISLTSDNIRENPTCRECQRRRLLQATLGRAYNPGLSLIAPVYAPALLSPWLCKPLGSGPNCRSIRQG